MLNYADFFTLAEVAERLCIPVAAPQNYLLAPEASSPAASARIQPVLRRSGPSRPSRKAAAADATLGCVNKQQNRVLEPRSSAD
jgi:hypothetical protein